MGQTTNHWSILVNSVTWVQDHIATSTNSLESILEIELTLRKTCESSFNMASIIPTLLLSAAAEAFVLILAVPQFLPANPLLWTLIRTTILNVGLYLVYKVFVYPFMLSPIRHLPSPSVSISQPVSVL